MIYHVSSVCSKRDIRSLFCTHFTMLHYDRVVLPLVKASILQLTTVQAMEYQQKTYANITLKWNGTHTHHLWYVFMYVQYVHVENISSCFVTIDPSSILLLCCIILVAKQMHLNLTPTHPLLFLCKTYVQFYVNRSTRMIPHVQNLISHHSYISE